MPFSPSMRQQSVFDYAASAAAVPPQTEGIKYAGSKLKFIAAILELAKKTRADSVFDGFAGTTRVSQAFARCGYRVIANDISQWSRTFATCYLLNRKEMSAYAGLINHLNAVPPKDGWFTQMYGGDVMEGGAYNAIQPDGSKKPWQKKNTRKLDAIREEIDRLALDEVAKSVALTSLILALDRVDSTLGHYVAYLKDWSPRSFNAIELKVPNVWRNHQAHSVLAGDVFDSLALADADLAYYDPPYGSNNDKMPASRVRYAAYYHLWTTVIKNDQPALFGHALRRKDTSDTVAASIFEEFRKSASGRFFAVEAIEKLINQTPCEWMIFSYSSGGRATAKELNEVINDNGELIEMIEINYKKNVMAAMKWTNEWSREAEPPNREFLFLICKRKRRYQSARAVLA